MTMTADPDVQPPAGGADLAGLVDDDLIARLAGQARAQGVSLVGEGGLLQQLTKRVLEAALEGEMDAHLGSGKHERGGRVAGNARNGRRAKTVLTEAGPVELDVPRDRDGSFTPQIVRKRPEHPQAAIIAPAAQYTVDNRSRRRGPTSINQSGPDPDPDRSPGAGTTISGNASDAHSHG
jgi:hypothetical protein